MTADLKTRTNGPDYITLTEKDINPTVYKADTRIDVDYIERYNGLLTEVKNLVEKIEDRKDSRSVKEKFIGYFSNILNAIFFPNDVITEFDVMIECNDILNKETINH